MGSFRPLAGVNSVLPCKKLLTSIYIIYIYHLSHHRLMGSDGYSPSCCSQNSMSPTVLVSHWSPGLEKGFKAFGSVPWPNPM